MKNNSSDPETYVTHTLKHIFEACKKYFCKFFLYIYKNDK